MDWGKLLRHADVVDFAMDVVFGGLTSIFAGKIVEKKKNQPSTEFSDREKRRFAPRANTHLSRKSAAKMGHPVSWLVRVRANSESR